MSHINNYLDKRDMQLIAIKPLRIILTKEDFANGIANEVDENIETFGVFNIESLDGKDSFKCNFPIIITLNVLEREEENGLIYLNYQPNDIVIEKMGFFKGPKQANGFLDLLNSGKFVGLTQEEIVAAFNTNMRMNGANPGVQSELVETMVSELVRWKKDPSVPFRLKNGS